jgi:peptidyl-prolyl cis-trans isomerase B (cyclophilin B)
MKRYFLYVLMALMTLVLVACNSDGNKNEKDALNNESTSGEAVSNENYEENVTENPIVTITMESDEQIIIELMPKTAPNTVANFVTLVQEGFYDGTIFHRVIPGFMIQGGDPTGTGTGGPSYSIAGEFTSNGFENTLVHDRGVISMARSQSPDSAGSQFFIMVETATHLDGNYAAFGKVIEGMEVVDRIVSVERNANDKPLQEQKMKSVVVDTKGFNYPKPITSGK